MFTIIKELSKSIYNYDYNPHTLLADAAHAITNGFLSVFPVLKKRIVCWAHVERKIEEQLKGVAEFKQ